MTHKTARVCCLIVIDQVRMFMNSLNEDSLEVVIPPEPDDFAYTVVKMVYDDLGK